MVVAPGVVVPLAEVELRVSRSSGPGGQHANVTASRVEAVFDIAASSTLGQAHKQRLTTVLGPRPSAVAQDTRSQARNRELALERLRGRLATALLERPPRRPTRPTRTADARRVEDKRRTGQRKRARQRRSTEEER